MALGRLGIPGLVLYNGTIYPGTYKGEPADIVIGVRGDRRLPGRQDHARGAVRGRGGRVPRRGRVRRPVHGQHDGDGAASSWACRPAGINGIPAEDPKKDEAARRAGELVMTLVRHDIRPADIVTRRSLENAIASVSATGGSTNAALHLPAIAAEFGMTLTLDEFTAVADRTPLIADMRPGGRYAAADMYDAGGVGLVMRELLKGGPAPRRRADRGRAHDREGRGRHRRDARPAGRPVDRQPDQGDRRDHDPARQPRARRVRPQAGGRRAAPAPRAGPRVRLRGGLLRGRHASDGSSRATSS